MKKKSKNQITGSPFWKGCGNTADAFHIVMRPEKCCTSVILLHQKPNPPHLCLHPTLAFQKGAAGVPFLHIYIWLKALNDYGMKNILADLREILHFETMSKTLVKDASYLTANELSYFFTYIFRFRSNFQSANAWIICFLPVTGSKRLEPLSYFLVHSSLRHVQISWPSLRGPIIMYFVHMQPIIWNKGRLERAASLKQSHILAFWRTRR